MMTKDLTHSCAKNAIQGNLKSCVSTKTFCTNTFGEQLCCRQNDSQSTSSGTSDTHAYIIQSDSRLHNIADFSHLDFITSSNEHSNVLATTCAPISPRKILHD